MLKFRKMNMSDLESVFRDPFLKSLITVEPKGVKFSVVIEHSGKIIGGISGYIDGNAALIQCMRIILSPDIHLLQDGLVRSLIHILELDGVEFLITCCQDPLYKSIGFVVLDEAQRLLIKSDLIDKDISNKTCLIINLKEFFQ